VPYCCNATAQVVKALPARSPYLRPVLMEIMQPHCALLQRIAYCVMTEHGRAGRFLS
jgi:hypothetical protein